MTEISYDKTKWLNLLEKDENLTMNDINILRQNIPERMRSRTKERIYKIIDNYCLKTTGCIDKEEM